MICQIYLNRMRKKMEKLIEALNKYTEEHKEIPGTAELFEQTVSMLQETTHSAIMLKERYVDGKNVSYQGDDADDEIKCPFCGFEVARNDDYEEMKPKHCPECGAKLLY